MEEKILKVTEDTEIVIDEDRASILNSEYRELVSKATALDILSAAMQRMGKVDDNLVWAVTGANPDKQIKELQAEKDRYWEWYSKEREKAEGLQKQVETLQRKLNETEATIEALRQDEETEESNG